MSGAADREIVTARVIDTPRERVFGAWTDPAQLTQDANEQNLDRLEAHLAGRVEPTPGTRP